MDTQRYSHKNMEPKQNIVHVRKQISYKPKRNSIQQGIHNNGVQTTSNADGTDECGYPITYQIKNSFEQELKTPRQNYEKQAENLDNAEKYLLVSNQLYRSKDEKPSGISNSAPDEHSNVSNQADRRQSAPYQDVDSIYEYPMYQKKACREQTEHKYVNERQCPTTTPIEMIDQEKSYIDRPLPQQQENPFLLESEKEKVSLEYGSSLLVPREKRGSFQVGACLSLPIGGRVSVQSETDEQRLIQAQTDNLTKRSSESVHLQCEYMATKNALPLPDTTDQVICEQSPISHQASPVSSGSSLVTDCVKMSRFLYNLWRKQQMCDMILKVNGHDFPVHKIALAAHSEKYSSQFCERFPYNVHEMSVSNSSPAATEEIVRYLYTSELHVSYQNIDALLGGARYLAIPTVINACKDFLANCSVDYVLPCLPIAKKHQLWDVLEQLDNVACENFSDVISSAFFPHLTYDHIQRLVLSDYLKVDCELQVFRAIISWIDFSREDRMRYAPDLMSSVRFMLISPKDLATSVEPVDYIFQISGFQQILYNAFRYHALKEFESQMISKADMPSIRQCCHHICDITKASDKLTIEDESAYAIPSINKSKVESDQAELGILAIAGVDPFTGNKENQCSFVEEYSLSKKCWNLLTCLPDPRHHHGAAALDGYIYIIGGSILSKDDPGNLSNPTSTCFRYDVVKDSWKKVASLQFARMYHAVAVLGGVLYAIGGRDEYSKAMRSVEYYNPDNDSWRLTAPISEAKIGLSAVGYNGMVYVTGGFCECSEQKHVMDTVECYNPRTNTWKVMNPLPTPSCHACLLRVKNSLYHLGGSTIPDGQQSIFSLDDVLLYSEADDRWDCVQKMQVPRHDAGSCAIGSKIFIVGGVNSEECRALSDVECLDVDTGECVQLNPLSHASLGLMCCLCQR